MLGTGQEPIPMEAAQKDGKDHSALLQEIRKYNELLSKTSPKVKLAYETPDGMVIYEHTYARKAGQPWNRGIAL
ncbi:MAG: hypothetical protein OSJ38_03470 [Lachnospiraceae bacterium]|nr:hypothetical protein [Lachnospiraceae bacterium]MCX4346292.1 hypothetical protein [Lachnospiraceae bacterium]